MGSELDFLWCFRTHASDSRGFPSLENFAIIFVPRKKLFTLICFLKVLTFKMHLNYAIFNYILLNLNNFHSESSSIKPREYFYTKFKLTLSLIK